MDKLYKYFGNLISNHRFAFQQPAPQKQPETREAPVAEPETGAETEPGSEKAAKEKLIDTKNEGGETKSQTDTTEKKLFEAKKGEVVQLPEIDVYEGDRDSTSRARAVKEGERYVAKQKAKEAAKEGKVIQGETIYVTGKRAELTPRQQKIYDSILAKLNKFQDNPDKQAKILAKYEKSVFKNARKAAEAVKAQQGEQPSEQVSKSEEKTKEKEPESATDKVESSAAEMLSPGEKLAKKTMDAFNTYVAFRVNGIERGKGDKMLSHLEGTIKDMVERGVSEKGINAFTDKIMAMIEDFKGLDQKNPQVIMEKAQALNLEMTQARYQRKYDKA